MLTDLDNAIKEMKAKNQNGGSLNDALSKDIQIELIGGARLSGDRVWNYVAGFRALIRYNVPAIRPILMGCNACSKNWF